MVAALRPHRDEISGLSKPVVSLLAMNSVELRGATGRDRSLERATDLSDIRATRESVTASDRATTQHFKGRRVIGGAGREGHGRDPSRERATRNGQDRRGHALRGPVVRAQHMQQRISRERLIPAVDFATAGPIIDIAELRKSGGSVSAAGCRQVIASRAGAGGRIWGLGPSGWRVVPGTEVAKNLLESCSCQSGFKKP